VIESISLRCTPDIAAAKSGESVKQTIRKRLLLFSPYPIAMGSSWVIFSENSVSVTIRREVHAPTNAGSTAGGVLA
jgi:hypothetical protein